MEYRHYHVLVNFLVLPYLNHIWRAFSMSFATRWIVGQDGEQGKVIFPESFNGVIATEVNHLDLYCKSLIN